MKNTHLFSVLINLGLSEKEAEVYLACLSLGPTTALKISRSASLKRSTVYTLIETLKQKGLMSMEVKGFKTLFVAENPEKLEIMLKAKKEELKRILPDLVALYNLKGGEGKIKYYEGLESVKSVYEFLLRDIKSHEDYLVIGEQNLWYKLDIKYFQDFIVRRSKLNINIRLLFPDSKIAREHKKIEKNYNEKIKILPPNTHLTTNMIITPQHLVIHQLTSPISAIVIENKSTIQTQRELFEIIWRSISD
jgi:sugar-specific transcriptional regulator TrmB